MLLADFATEYPFWAERVSLGVGLVRVVLGITLAAHGYGKFFRGGRIPGTAGWFDSMGMRPGKFHAYLAASTEVGAGVLFALGLLTPLAAAAALSPRRASGRYFGTTSPGFWIATGHTPPSPWSPWSPCPPCLYGQHVFGLRTIKFR